MNIFLTYLSFMIKSETFEELALSLPGTAQKPHFDRTGFSVIGKRMFATYLPKNNTANIFLTPLEQAVFCKMDPDNIYPVPNKWGEKGATTFVLNKVKIEFVKEALLSAYQEVAKKK
jgi:YjbR